MPTQLPSPNAHRRNIFYFSWKPDASNPTYDVAPSFCGVTPHGGIMVHMWNALHYWEYSNLQTRFLVGVGSERVWCTGHCCPLPATSSRFEAGPHNR